MQVHPVNTHGSTDRDVEKEATNEELLSVPPPPTPKPPASMLFSVSVAGFYGFMSASSILVNKYVLSEWHFNFPLTIVASQSLVSFILLVILKRLNVISYPDWSIETAKKTWILALVHVTNVLAGLFALTLIDVPMFGTLRRLVAACVMLLEFLMLGQTFSKNVMLSVAIMISGAIIGGISDLKFDLMGYLLTFITNLITAATLVLIPKVGKDANLGSFGLMLYQTTISFPVLLLLAYGSGEFHRALEFPFLHETSFQLSYMLSCVQIFILNYSIFWCTQVNSPLTTTVTGQLKNVLQIMGGFFLFDIPVVPINIFGILVGISGSFLYTYTKYLEFGGTKAVGG